MKNMEIPVSPSQSSANLLLDLSKNPEILSREMNDESSFQRRSSVFSMQGMDMSEMSPTKTIKSSVMKKMSDFHQRPEMIEIPQKASRKTIVLATSEHDNFLEKNIEFTHEIKTQKTDKGQTEENKMDLLSPLPSPQTTSSKKSGKRKSRVAGSFLTDWRNFEHSQSLARNGSAAGNMSFFALLNLAQKMGLIKRTHGYEEYLSNEQFNMIKDFSTGKFDSKEEKRSEQMQRLKKKLLLNSKEVVRHKAQKKKTYLSDWRENLLPTLRRLHAQFRETVTRVIAPNEGFRVIWDLYTMLLIFYDLVMLPLSFSFEVVLPYGFEIWNMVITGSFLLDVILNFNTGFYQKGMLVMERKKIIFHYLGGWFWIDFLASFPYEYVTQDPDNQDDDSSGAGTFQFIRIVRFLRFIKVIRVVRAFKLMNLFVKLESYVDLSATMTSIIGFLKLSIITLFIAHWFACIWHFVSVWELQDHPETWLTRHGVVDDYWTDRYVASIYWSTTTMITVGYGDIVPITKNEKIVAVFAMLVASGVFAYTMNRINVIMAGLETTSEQYQKALATITGYMRKKHVKKELQIKIKKYLEYALEVETSLDSNEECLNAYLNQSLKNELLLEIHGKILLENSIFLRFDNSLILKAAIILKEKIFSPEDTVFLEGEHDDCSIYIIHSGRVEIFNFKSNSFLKTLIKGNYFGEIAFLTGQPRTASVRSTDFSALYLVVRNDFLELLNEFPADKEKFHEVKDRLSIYQDQSVINLRCYSCGSSEHIVNECPKVHAVVPKARLLQTYISQRLKFMASYIRSGERSDKRPDRYSRMAQAAKKLRVQVWEGDVQVDKPLQYVNSNIEFPELSEHPWELISEMKAHRVPAFGQKDSGTKGKRMSIDVRMKTPMTQTLSSLDMESGGSKPHLESKEELKKKKKKKKAQSAVVFTPVRKKRSDNKKDFVERDIDKIANYDYYFTHNNFREIFPQPLYNKQTVNFDYFSHSDTTKDTLKKFINILKERVRMRKENEPVGKDKGKKGASFFKFGRSKFYKENASTKSLKQGGKIASPEGSNSPRAKADPKLDRSYDSDSVSDSEF